MAFPIRVRDVMSSPLRTAASRTSAAEAARTCRDADIGSLVVVDGGRVVGIVTNDDFVRLLGEASNPETRELGEFMSEDVVGVDVDTSVGDAVDTMFDHDVARLVVYEDGDPVGLVSTDDVVRYVPQVFGRHECEPVRPDSFQYRIFHETAYEETDWEVESVGLSDERVSVGDRVEFTKSVTERDVRTFAAVSGDTNRLHLDDEYATSTRFGRRIVHGTLVSGLISAALARFPGVTIYVSQDLSFLAPVDIGDRVTAVCEVVDDLGNERYQLTTDVVASDDERIIEGQAIVLIDDLPDVGHVTVEAIA